MTDWTEYQIVDLIKDELLWIGDGYRAKNSELTASNINGIPFARVKNVNGGFDFSDADFFPHKNVSKIGNKISQSGDIVFTSKGTVGRFAIVNDETKQFVYSPQLCFWRSYDVEFIIPRFLFYWMHSREFFAQVEAVKGQTDMADYVSLSDQRQMEITLPVSVEQKAITAVLASLDDKIDLLHRQNKTLEALAQTLFRHWFIDRAEDDWEVKPISHFGDVVCGKTPSKKNLAYFDGDIPFIKIPDMHGQVFVFKTSDTLSELGKKSQVKKTLPPRSISVSCIATVGLVTMNAFESLTNQQINTIVPSKDLYRYFLYLMMTNLRDELVAMASGGTATLNLNTGDFSRMHIVSPPEDLLEDFRLIVTPLFEKIFCNQSQIQTLEKLRDTLLPKLMSGEVRVRF